MRAGSKIISAVRRPADRGGGVPRGGWLVRQSLAALAPGWMVCRWLWGMVGWLGTSGSGWEWVPPGPALVGRVSSGYLPLGAGVGHLPAEVVWRGGVGAVASSGG